MVPAIVIGGPSAGFGEQKESGKGTRHKAEKEGKLKGQGSSCNEQGKK